MTPYQILVIDDNADTRELMKTVICMQGNVTCIFAVNGQDALDKLQVERPTLIIVDHNMDVMDGPTFILEFEKQMPDLFATIPVVMMTAHTLREIKVEKAKEILVKNGSLKDIKDLIRRYRPV